MLELIAYLRYALGEAARRRLCEVLTARGMRLWHLTTLALLADLGPQPKTVLAAGAGPALSDLTKIVKDLARAGQVVCVPDTEDRRRVYVRLTPDGRSALDHLAADVTAADEDLLAPLSGPKRDHRLPCGVACTRISEHPDGLSPGGRISPLGRVPGCGRPRKGHRSAGARPERPPARDLR